MNLLSALGPTFDHKPQAITDYQRMWGGRELKDTSEILAKRLIASGARNVALFADNAVDWVLADLACQLAGVVLVPLPGFFSLEQIEHSLATATVDTLMSDTELSKPFKKMGFVGGGTLGSLHLSHRHGQLASEGNTPPTTGKITFTSGSTGVPKGVCLSNAQLIDQARSIAERVGLDKPRHLCVLPLSLLLENVAGVYATLLSGGSVFIPRLKELGLYGSSSVDVQAFLDSIYRYQPNTLILIPQLLSLITTACEAGWRAPACLQFIAVGGSRVGYTAITRARHFGLPVYEGYGLSECASVVSLNTPGRDRPGSAGTSLPHLDLSVRNGEIFIAGNPFLGYVGDPQSWHQEEIASGDLGAIDSDGFLHLKGRRDNLLISSFGRNISPEWVESELLARGVAGDCLVFGDARPFLVALIHPRENISSQALQSKISAVNAHLPDYARIGRWLELPLPLNRYPGLTTATGKPKRAAILSHFHDQIDNLYQEQSKVKSA